MKELSHCLVLSKSSSLALATWESSVLSAKHRVKGEGTGVGGGAGLRGGYRVGDPEVF